MFKLKKRKKTKIYDFDYKMLVKNGKEITGHIVNSDFPPEHIFLNNVITYYKDGKCYYYRSDEIVLLEITNLVEREEN